MTVAAFDLLDVPDEIESELRLGGGAGYALVWRICPDRAPLGTSNGRPVEAMIVRRPVVLSEPIEIVARDVVRGWLTRDDMLVAAAFAGLVTRWVDDLGWTAIERADDHRRAASSNDGGVSSDRV